ncbi:hypothetical protein NP493_420g04027 [Ridgeia piscesae]|uniref:Uncharacterized protein n=1 Tax=Ridgeia piscesae TaxID=27915 RepID=A0AAD9L070_RIDPI|nr:hypothetical protein NP493_420g04027 [Ridgeia piscesae]
MGGHSHVSTGDSHQKDDHSVGDSLDVAGSPPQYEDCVEYIESGHSNSLTSVAARDRPETEGHEVLVEADRWSLPSTQVSGKTVTSDVDKEDISGGVTADSCQADPGHQAGDKLSSGDTAGVKSAKETVDMADVTFQTPFRTPAATVPPAGAQLQRSPKRFEDIRELDELENWRERATVVTILDHREYVTIVSDIISDLINNLPLSRYVTIVTDLMYPRQIGFINRFINLVIHQIHVKFTTQLFSDVCFTGITQIYRT